MRRLLAVIFVGVLGLTLTAAVSPLRSRPAVRPSDKVAALAEGSEGSAGSGSRGGAPAQPGERPIVLVVLLPATAQLEIDGDKTQQTGEVRRFTSPPLPVGKSYTYQLKATWTEGGKQVTRERVVPVRAGEATTADLRQEAPK